MLNGGILLIDINVSQISSVIFGGKLSEYSQCRIDVNMHEGKFHNTERGVKGEDGGTRVGEKLLAKEIADNSKS